MLRAALVITICSSIGVVATLSSVGATGRLPREGAASAAAHSWLEAGTRARHLLYVADGTNVDIYHANTFAHSPRLIGQITGLEQPTGVAVDANGYLYVVQGVVGAPVLVFAPGSTTPARELDVQGAWGDNIRIGRDGDVLVATSDGGPNNSSVLVYHAADTEPYAVLLAYFDGAFSMAPDLAGDVFYLRASGGDLGLTINEFKAHGRDTWKTELDLGFNPMQQPWAIAFDHAGNLVAMDYDVNWNLFVFAPGHKKTRTFLPLPSWQGGGPMVFDQSGKTLYVGSSEAGTNFVSALTYPSLNLRAVFTLPTGQASGIAVSPAAALPPRW
jgi:sugar lactone lactonase YvrE